MDHSAQVSAVAPEFVGGRDQAALQVTPTVAQEAGMTRAGALRLDAIDLLRGLVILLMVLDHVRDFLHAPAFVFSPTDLTQTNPILFMTRWVTHLCAPTFVFLAGVSIFMQRANGKSPAELSTFLSIRGLWLIVLEFTLVSFGFNWGPPMAFMQVIWAIGASMMLMSLVVRLPALAVGLLGFSIVVGHQLVASLIDATQLGVWTQAWFFTMQPGPTLFLRGFIPYPVIPWFGVMCLGYGLGFVFRRPSAQRRSSVLRLGVSFLMAFVMLRVINTYGDPSPWSVQSSPIMTLLSFINVSKYPPSLLYVLLTLGTSMLLFVALDKLSGPLQKVLLAFGRTSLFTYVMHIYLVHVLALVIGTLGGVQASYYFDFLSRFGGAVTGEGFELPIVYATWLLTLLLLYPLASWFARVKRERRDWWLSYM